MHGRIQHPFFRYLFVCLFLDFLDYFPSWSQNYFCCFLVYFICRLTTKQSSRSSSSAAATAAGAATTHLFYNDKLTTVYVLNYVDNFSKTDATKSQPTPVPQLKLGRLQRCFNNIHTIYYSFCCFYPSIRITNFLLLKWDNTLRKF